MMTLTADVPRLIGRDVAVFEFVAMGVMDARGLVKMTLGAPLGTSQAAPYGRNDPDYGTWEEVRTVETQPAPEADRSERGATKAAGARKGNG
jgi:hypothetical protein